MCSVKTAEELKLANDHLYEYMSQYSEIFKEVYCDDNGVPSQKWKEYFYKSTIPLLQKKGLFPYSFVTSDEFLLAKRDYPPKSLFYNKLRKEDCTDEEYNDAKELYLQTAFSSLGDSMALYNVTDTILLMVICKEQFAMLKKYLGLHPANLTSMSSLSVCAMARRSRCFVQHVPNDAMFEIIQQATRVHLRLGIDTRWMPKLSYIYDQYILERIVGCIVMCDENNQYGGAMTQELPTGGYRIRLDLKTYKALIAHYDSRPSNVSYCACVDMYLPDEKVNNLKPQHLFIYLEKINIAHSIYLILFILA